MSSLEPTPPWYTDGLRFGCTQCGNCCGGAPGYVWVTRDEISALAVMRQMDPTEFERRHVRTIGSRQSLLERPNGDCEFLARDDTGKARCSVYAARPVQCRTWPFWKSNLRSAREWTLASQNCPGINKGDHHPLPVIAAALERNANLPL